MAIFQSLPRGTSGVEARVSGSAVRGAKVPLFHGAADILPRAEAVPSPMVSSRAVA